MPNQTDKIYTENSSTAVGNRDYPLVAAMGNNAFTKPYMINENFQDLITANTRRPNASYDLSSIDPKAQNDFLDIPSFLYYPQDLGRNQRYHHFMTFNIYQGTSDQTRLVQRNINQMTSAYLAKGGGLQFGSQIKGDSGVDANYVTLMQAGFTAGQIQEFLKSFEGSSAALRAFGITSDERINQFEQVLQGKIQNLFNESQADGSGLLGAVYDTATGFFGDLGKEVYGYLAELLEATNRDMLDPANQTKRNFDEVGASGKKVNRQKSEQNILLANRRFNFTNVKSKDTICLYMPLKFSISDQLIYSEEDMSGAKGVMDTLVGKRGGFSGVFEKAGTKTISDMVDKLATGINLEATNIQAVRNAATRSVSNPRREVMFKDVGIRSHSFSFDFYPKNATEAQTVLDIIKLLRYHAYPGLRGGGGHFFTFPAEFEVAFNTISPEGIVMTNDNLPKLARLALQSVVVDYAAAGDFKTFPDGKPAFIHLDLGFQEMEQLTNEHIIHGY